MRNIIILIASIVLVSVGVALTFLYVKQSSNSQEVFVSQDVVAFEFIGETDERLVYEDSDGDSVPDGVEELFGLSLELTDTDNDGIVDVQEVMDVLHQHLTIDAQHDRDSDGDGILDYIEIAIQTDMNTFTTPEDFFRAVAEYFQKNNLSIHNND
jgi:hypothetical protein